MTRLLGPRGQLAMTACMFGMLMANPQPGNASSGDAWEEFENDVRNACLSAALGSLAVNTIQIDPYGSESYGFAVMVGFEAGTTNERVMVCAYDKATQKAEVSGLFGG